MGANQATERREEMLKTDWILERVSYGSRAKEVGEDILETCVKEVDAEYAV